ncbi:MAG TPA: CHRD domain-containing protein [Candidatus Dormibacteraeota bacterium]
MPRLGIGALITTLALGALAACGGSSGSPTGTQTTPGPTTAAGVSSAVVPLRHVPTGEATLAYDTAAKTLTVEVRLTGLAPNSVHPAHIHSGRCARQGPIAYPLNNVQADGHGVADAVTAVPAIREGGIPDAAWYVNVHNGPNLTPDAQFEPIVCGDVANPSRGAHVAVPLQQGPPPTSPPSNPDQSASGTAQLTIRGGALAVVLDVTGLRPSSSHAVHIHLGSCASQGAVIHALPNLTADPGGHATLTATVSNVSSIPTGTWYVNVHRTTAVTAGQTDFDPILCGDVGGASGY